MIVSWQLCECGPARKAQPRGRSAPLSEARRTLFISPISSSEYMGSHGEDEKSSLARAGLTPSARCRRMSMRSTGMADPRDVAELLDQLTSCWSSAATWTSG